MLCCESEAAASADVEGVLVPAVDSVLLNPGCVLFEQRRLFTIVNRHTVREITHTSMCMRVDESRVETSIHSVCFRE